ncbi:TetR/AcrR family transcriptional regulator, partial [Streptomyces hydrogenans]
MESVLGEAVALLDEAGAPALTFRALAQRLGGGVASIYWYVANKDELLDLATDHVMGGVLADIEKLPPGEDAIDDLRAMALTLFDAVVRRPWLGAYFMRNTDV